MPKNTNTSPANTMQNAFKVACIFKVNHLDNGLNSVQAIKYPSPPYLFIKALHHE